MCHALVPEEGNIIEGRQRIMKRKIFYLIFCSVLFLSLGRIAIGTPQEKCNDKITNILLGRGPTIDELQMESSQLIARHIKDDVFIERFSRHTNDYFNDSISSETQPRMPHTTWQRKLSKRTCLGEKCSRENTVLWPKVKVKISALEFKTMIKESYFTSRDWSIRYEGNEEAGFQLKKAYRIPHNIVGLRLPAIDAQGADRKDPTGTCYSCHFNPKNAFALDLIAQALPLKRIENGEPRSGEFVEPNYPDITAAPDVLLATDVVGLKSVVSILLSDKFKPDYQFNTCRMVFNFVFGRDDTKAVKDDLLFDVCMKSFEQKNQKKISALL